MKESTEQHTSSYYADTANPSNDRQKLQGDKTCDICIVGAGFSGVSAGLYLVEAGYKVIVLEAAKIGWGASGRNGGQMVNGFSRGYKDIKKNYGEDSAQAFVDMSFEGSDIIRERVEKYNIDCDLKTTGNFFAAFTDSQMGDLEEHKKIWEKLGHDSLDLVGKDRINEIIGSELYCGGLQDPRGGHIHPLNLVLGQAEAIESLGGEIYEHSHVTHIEKKDKPKVITNEGIVTSDFIILCGNAYLDKSVPEIASHVLPVTSQVIVTEVLGKELTDKMMPADVCIEDCNYVLDSFRITGDKRLLLGGGIVYTGRHPKDIKKKLEPHVLKIFPELKGRKFDYAWSGTMAFTHTRLPHVGRINDNIYFTQGYSGHGVTTAHLIGRLIAEAIDQQSSRIDVFASIKPLAFPGGRAFRVPLTIMGAWYYQIRDRLGI